MHPRTINIRGSREDGRTDSWSCALKGESQPEDNKRQALLDLVRSLLSTINMLATSLRMLT